VLTTGRRARRLQLERRRRVRAEAETFENNSHPTWNIPTCQVRPPKKLDERWDSQNFRYSKLFPLKTNFFTKRCCLPAFVYPRPYLLHPPASALSFKCTLMFRARNELSFKNICHLRLLGSLPNQGALPPAMELSYLLVWAFLFVCLSFPNSLVSRGRTPPDLPVAPRSVAAETRRPPP
jgi:hypothetical protein